MNYFKIQIVNPDISRKIFNRNILIWFVFVSLYAFPVFAQNRVGIQAGLNLALGKYEYFARPEVKISSSLNLTGSGFFEFDISKNLSSQIGFGYIQKGCELSPLYDPNGIVIPGSKEIQTLDFLNFSFYFQGRTNFRSLSPFLSLGPSLSILIKSEGKRDYPPEFSYYNGNTIYNNIKPFDLSIDISGGIQVLLSEKIFITPQVKYSFGLLDINKSENIVKKTSGLQFLFGIGYSPIPMEIYNVNEKPDYERNEFEDSLEISEVIVKSDSVIIPQAKVTPMEVKVIIKEFDPTEYNVPIFITGYYRPITKANIDNLYKLFKKDLKNAGYIEQFPKNSKRYRQYQNWAKDLDIIFNQFNKTCIDSVFPNFIKNSGPIDTLEIQIFGYADPRPITGIYVESEKIEFLDTNGRIITMNKGDDLDNLRLSGLRAWHAGKFFDSLFSQSYFVDKDDYRILKKQNRILFRYIGADIATGASSIDMQRRIKIRFLKKIGF